MNKWLSSTAIVGIFLVQISVQFSYGEGSIVFVRGEDPKLYSINPDGTNLAVVTEGRNPVWSPDGNSILVKRGGNMWIVSSDGSVSTPLGETFEYSWSRNGQQIVFNRGNGLYLVNKDGSGEKELIPIASSVASPRWSPKNDSLVVYHRRRTGESRDIFFINVITGESRLVRERAYTLDIPHPFSADGTRLLVSTCLDGSSCIKVLNLTTGELVQIGPSGRGGAERPAWSPDGNRIAFDVFDGGSGLHLASLDGQVITELVPRQTGLAPAGAVWSPSGDRIAFTMIESGTQKRQLYVINADSTGMRHLTEGAALSWSPTPSGVPGGTSIQMLPWGLLKAQWRQ